MAHDDFRQYDSVETHERRINSINGEFDNLRRFVRDFLNKEIDLKVLHEYAILTGILPDPKEIYRRKVQEAKDLQEKIKLLQDELNVLQSGTED